MTSKTEIKPVLIVGAGPTGMTAAMELARFGIPVRLVEKKAEPETTSRAIGVQARTLELFEQRGLAEEMVRLGNPGEATGIYGDGKKLFRIDFCRLDSLYRYILLLSQAETERILRERLAEAGVTIERPVEMIALAQRGSAEHPGEGGVSATLRHADGALEEVEASYLISSEGAHSTVRGTLGLKFAGVSFQGDYTLGDLHVDGDLPTTELSIFSSPHGFLAMLPLGGSRFRLIASNPLSKPSKDGSPALEELQKIYDTRSHLPARFHDLTWSSWFRINSRMVERLQHGHVFLGGDSAHIHSPAGGQGMNTGIQDMINLGWKLAMVLQGKASPALLDTYGDDRLPVIRSVLRNTEGLTKIIGTENPVARGLFEHVAPLVVGTGFVQEKATRQVSQIGLNYRKSPLSQTYSHHGELLAGDRVPDMALRIMDQDGSPAPNPREARLFSLFDAAKFSLLAANLDDPAKLHARLQPELEPWQTLFKSSQITPSQTDAVAAQHFAKTFGTSPALVLVRPDSYVGLIGGTGDLANLTAYLRKWFPPEKQPATDDHFSEGHLRDDTVKS